MKYAPRGSGQGALTATTLYGREHHPSRQPRFSVERERAQIDSTPMAVSPPDHQAAHATAAVSARNLAPDNRIGSKPRRKLRSFSARDRPSDGPTKPIDASAAGGAHPAAGLPSGSARNRVAWAGNIEPTSPREIGGRISSRKRRRDWRRAAMASLCHR